MKPKSFQLELLFFNKVSHCRTALFWHKMASKAGQEKYPGAALTKTFYKKYFSSTIGPHCKLTFCFYKWYVWMLFKIILFQYERMTSLNCIFWHKGLKMSRRVMDIFFIFCYLNFPTWPLFKVYFGQHRVLISNFLSFQKAHIAIL